MTTEVGVFRTGKGRGGAGGSLGLVGGGGRGEEEEEGGGGR